MTLIRQASRLRALLFALTAPLGLASGAAFAQSAPADAAAATAVVNPHSPRAGHPYRHGVVPTVETHALMQAWAQNQWLTTATGPQTLAYGGGVDGIGVTSGVPKVYLVVYGSQWGTAGTDASGNLTLTGDTVGAVPYLQKLFKGLGTGGELWSGVVTQYCDGPLVAAGAVTCPANAPHVGYPTGGAFAGIWYDNAAASPAQATGKQLAQEAVKAAAHFGNTTAASNRYAQYVILSPTGTKPDGFNTAGGGFCAWHDWNGDTTLSGGGAATSPYGDIAFTNMPYVYDLGASCGANSVVGVLDGFSIVEGHEYAETVTDQNPAGGWTNHTGSASNGQENGDECAWIKTGQGATALVAMGTGSFPMQSSWSNDTNRCDLSHPIVTGGTGTGGTPLANFSFTTSGLTATFTDSSTDTGGTLSAHAWNFGDGSTSTATSPSHTYAVAGTYSVSETVTDSVSGATSTKTVSLTVSSGGGGSSQLLLNTGFESGVATPWTLTSGVLCSNATCAGQTAHAGTWFAWLNGYGSTHTDSATQTVAITAGKASATLAFYLHIDTKETGSTAYDTLKVQVLNSANTVLATLATYSNANAAAGYALKSFNLNAYIGQTVKIKFTGTEDVSLATSFVLDDVTLTVN